MLYLIFVILYYFFSFVCRKHQDEEQQWKRYFLAICFPVCKLNFYPMNLWNIGIVCFIIELHQFTSGTPYIPQKRKQNLHIWSLYHSRERIVAASRPLQIYTESANPIGAVLACFLFFGFFFVCFVFCFVLIFLAT